MAEGRSDIDFRSWFSALRRPNRRDRRSQRVEGRWQACDLNDEAPGRLTEGPQVSSRTATIPVVALGADVLREPDALAAHFVGAFVGVVRINGTHYRHRCYDGAHVLRSPVPQ